MGKISGEQNIRCERRTKNSLMYLFSLFTVRTGNDQPMRCLCFLLKDGKSINQFNMALLRMNNPRRINNIRTPNGKGFNHQRFLRLQMMRVKEIRINSIVDNPYSIFRNTVIKQIIFNVVTGTDNPFDGFKCQFGNKRRYVF